MSAQVAAADAERAVARLGEMSVDLRACAILGTDGEQLAVSVEAGWSACVSELWSAAADPDRPRPTQVHVATLDGEVFAVRCPSGRSAVAVTDRFALASLMFCDLRAALRDLDPSESNAVAGES